LTLRSKVITPSKKLWGKGATRLKKHAMEKRGLSDIERRQGIS